MANGDQERRAGTLVLVDGWNHYVRTGVCHGRQSADLFDVDLLASKLVSDAGLPEVSGVVVFMALPDRNRPEESAEFHAWRRRLRRLANRGVRHEKARFAYHSAVTACPGCGGARSAAAHCPRCGDTPVATQRREEKGADVRLTAEAIDATRRARYEALLLLSQDSDFTPMVQLAKSIHLEQGRPYRLFSASPTCQKSGHAHRGVPGTHQLLIPGDWRETPPV